MFRSGLAAALRHLYRNRLYTVISIAVLAVGLCVALVAALVIRNQYSYDRDVQGYERTFVLLAVFSPPGLAPQYGELTLLEAAAQLNLDSAQIEAVSRVLDEEMRLEANGLQWSERVYWADASLPDVLPGSVYAGDVAKALQTADGLVLSRSYARRFFGRDTPLGETLTVDGHPMVVRAVIEDPMPYATHTQRHVIGAGGASFSTIAVQERQPDDRLANFTLVSGLTYIRLTPHADRIALERAVQQLVQRQDGVPAMLSAELVRIDQIHSHEGLNPGFRDRMVMLAILGAAVLLVACVNFVNLQTARSRLRAREVAIRRVAGARRGTIVVQLLGETTIHASTALLLAVAAMEWVLPQVNAFLDTGAVLNFDREPWLIAALAGMTIMISLAAGAWPALVQSGIRPVDALRGTKAVLVQGRGAQSLVTLQFALLIALAICAGIVHQQRDFALQDSLNVDHGQVLMIVANRSAFTEELRELPGVRAVTRSDIPFLGSAGFGPLRGISLSSAYDNDGRPISVHMIGVDLGLFDFYGIRPLAGRLPAASGEMSRITSNYVVVNETAARRMTLGAPKDALEKELPIGMPSTRVLAVMPDFSLDSVSTAVPPTIYFQPEKDLDLVHVRLSGQDLSETLASIDDLWAKTGNTGPASEPFRFFLEEHFQRHYQGVLRQSQAFGICALIALVLSCIGLFALTAATAERRTREISIRKALGAGTGNVVLLMLLQFIMPVVWANLIAWPVAGFMMHRWLAGFAYHVEFPIWLFPATAMGTLLISLMTVVMQVLRIARTRPITALRHA